MSFLNWCPRTECRTAGGVPPEQTVEAEPLPLPAEHTSCGTAQGTAHIAGTLIHSFIHQYPQVLVCRAALNLSFAESIHHPVCVDMKDCPDPGVESYTQSFWISHGLHGPLSPANQGIFKDNLFQLNEDGIVRGTSSSNTSKIPIKIQNLTLEFYCELTVASNLF